MNNAKIRIIILFSLFCASIQAQNDSVKFYYLGHSSFLISFDNDTSILTDYGKPNAYLEYGWDSPIYDIGNFQPTICTYSHSHDDHYDSTRISFDNCITLNKADTLTFKNLVIYPILTSENNVSIKDNRSYLIDYKGIKILHLGDCQANIINIDSFENVKYVRNNIPLDCDVVLIPIESTSKFIPQLERFIRVIHPKTVIPMHYWSNEYKQEFLTYLENENFTHQELGYKITIVHGSKYTYHRNKDTNEIIHIMSLSPSKFSNQ